MLSKLIERIRAVAGPQDNLDDEPRTLELAAAALLWEVANADRNISTAERQQIRQTLKASFTLDDQTLNEILEESEATVEHSVGVQPLTRTLTDHWSEPQRFDLVVALWRVALADQVIDAFEEHRIRAIADLLYVSHKRFIEAKLIAKRASSG
ncbi:MAG: TerB family tellurite resistance protein [Pseudomonadales bacterium]